MAVGLAALSVLYAAVDWKRSADERLQRSVEPAHKRAAVARAAPLADRSAAPVAVAVARATLATRPSVALPLAPQRTTIYRCKGEGGATFWSGASCQTQRATVERTVTVPVQLPFEQQVAIASGAADEAEWLYRPAAVANKPGSAGAAPVSPRRGECLAFDDSIRQIDAATRRPLIAAQQDHLRAQRAGVQGQRFAAHC